LGNQFLQNSSQVNVEITNCPICNSAVSSLTINQHVDDCLTQQLLSSENQTDRSPPINFPKQPIEGISVSPSELRLCRDKSQSLDQTLQTDMDKECSICFEVPCKGEVISRLECLCVFHKICIERWFEKSKFCPLHNPSSM